MRKAITVACVLALVLASLIPLSHAITIPGPAPDFTLTDLDGNTFSLSDYIGKRVLLNFMGTL